MSHAEIFSGTPSRGPSVDRSVIIYNLTSYFPNMFRRDQYIIDIHVLTVIGVMKTPEISVSSLCRIIEFYL